MSGRLIAIVGGARRGRSAAAWAGRLGAIGLLTLLSVWAIVYEAAFLEWPAVATGALPFRGIAPDIAFLLAGGLLICRGFVGERGWALIGAGALCWASGDIYWTLGLSNPSNPPVPSLADAGYLAFCPFAFLGILSLVRQRAARVPMALAADAAAATLAVGAAGAALVLEPVMSHARAAASPSPPTSPIRSSTCCCWG